LNRFTGRPSLVFPTKIKEKSELFCDFSKIKDLAAREILENLSGKSFLALGKGSLEHGNANHVLGGARQDLHILGQAPKMPQPSKRPFDHPTFGVHHKPLTQARHDMEDQVEVLMDKRHRRAPIPLIATKRLNSGILPRCAFEHLTPGDGVGLVSRMHLDMEQIPQCIYDDMPLAPLDFLMPVDPSLLTPILGLDTLRVDESVTGGGRFGRFFRCRAVISPKACSHTPRKFQWRK
jgi:hypothetical protein